jgi:HD-like signal output (HDOD) protein
LIGAPTRYDARLDDKNPAMTTSPTSAKKNDPLIDKKGAELDRQRFRMLEDIAAELSSDVLFPTSFESVAKIRKALQEADISLQKVASVVALDPLVSSRVLALANSTMFNPGGAAIQTIQGAIERVGLQNVRVAALSVATKGLLLSRDVASFRALGDRLWQHSLKTASAAYVLAKRRSRLPPDEAMLAGMIHDIGAFYMIYRAMQYEELVLRPDSMKYLIVHWHESVGHAVALALGLPESLAEAIRDHDQPRVMPKVPGTLADIVYMANLLAGGSFEWLDMPTEIVASQVEQLQHLFEELGEEIDECEQSLMAAIG